ncbi:Endonuclease/exonuclease/phosphatase [Mycena rosella]|uniref:Endonuclease/exonuclease/phosphatase n=1 Tax=Mycena rosella TaxID=1033263 RepID=A0AAD7G7X5_MYCRO|nr:Endonuclease/exonuclease/phosphatase [Mycena rosella]
MADQLRVLTLNCWGLKYVAKNRTERITAIAKELAKFDHDIIGLQEIWVFADYEHVRDSVLKRLPYSKFFYSGALGSGLALFSRFPIIGTSVHPYSLNGTPIDVGGGDWFVGKAAFSKLARQAAELGRYVISTGDFNSIPSTLPMALIREYAALSDSWAPRTPRRLYLLPLRHGRRHPIRRHRRLAAQFVLGGEAIGPYARKFLGKRLDYILYRQPVRPLTRPDDPLPVLQCIECNVVLTEKVPGRAFSYSDHFGLEATLEIRTGDQVPADLADAHNVWSTANSAGAAAPVSELSADSLSTTMQALAACYRFSANARARSSYSSCFASSFSWPRRLLVVAPTRMDKPIFILFTVFIAWLATTMLYEGFLYGNWECNALMNVIEELEIYKNSLEMQAGTS